MNDVLIAARELTRRFGGFTAVDHVSFEVYADEVLGYLGPNGSGKTTTIRMLLGILRPTSGDASVMGYNIRREAEQIRSHVGYMSQKFALYDELTVLENLTFYAGVYNVDDGKHIANTLARVGLTGHERERAGELPVGWRQRLALATAIVHEPRLLFLDEPTGGVDPDARRSFWDLIYELVESGMTAFVTTHYMDEAEYCHRVGIMREGKLLAIDRPEYLKETAVSGRSFDVFTEPLLPAMRALEEHPGVIRTVLAGDHLRVILQEDTRKGDVRIWLENRDLGTVRIRKVEPSLEDVFISLASA